MQKIRYSKDLMGVRIVATVVVILALILPYFGFISYRITPFLILATIVVFYIIEGQLGN